MSGKYALIIGNTEYIDSGLAQLTAPGKDAEDFARVLKDKEIGAFDQVKILLDQLSSTVIEAIDEFFDQKKPDDLLVLYFSGHGVRDELGSLYLAFKNTIRSRLRSTAVKSDYIREAMDQSRSKRQVVILDCCNSGAFPQGTKAEVGGMMGMVSALQGYGRFVLTASDATQFAWEGNTVIGETQNSLFTHFLVKGLEGDADKNGDGRITVDELYDYAFEQISSLTPKQTPTKSISKQEGEIILRQNMRLEDIKPVPLPTILLDSIENPFPDVRLGAVQQLTKMLNGKNLALARSAREALERMAEDDDSRQVSKAAAQALQSLDPGKQQVAHEKTDQKRLAPEKAETERLAPEKLKRETLTQQKAEAGRLAREKAKAERKAKEEANRETEEKAEKEKAERERTERKATRSQVEQEKDNRVTPAKAQQEAVRKADINESKAVKARWITPTTVGMVVIALILCGFVARNYFGHIGSSPVREAPTPITEEPMIPATEAPGSISTTTTKTPRPTLTGKPRSTSTLRPTLTSTSRPTLTSTSRPTFTFTPRPASGTCKDGYVYRLITSSDQVCVSPERKVQADADNDAAESRKIRSVLINSYGENACASGYVWRNAYSGDLVCVDPGSRDQAERDNFEGPSRIDQASSPYCVSGYVWRVAIDSDLVCVEPWVRDQTAAENSQAESRKAINVYSEYDCVDGYVWREAFEGDLVCVTLEERQQVAEDNNDASNHTWP